MHLCSGLKIIGGISEGDEDDVDFGIFVKTVLPNGVAFGDGTVHLYEIIFWAKL